MEVNSGGLKKNLMSDQSVLVDMEVRSLNDMSFFFCPLLGFRKIQAVNETVQEIQVQVDSNQVYSWLQGSGVTCRDGLEPLHSNGGIMGRYLSQNTEFGKSCALLVFTCLSFL